MNDAALDSTPGTIPAAVMATIQRLGSSIAVVDGDQRVTYQELGQRVIDATKAMMAAGVERGDRVAVWAPNSLGWIVAALSAHCAGAALVPINTRWKGGEAAYVLSAAKVKVLCTSVGFLGTDTVRMLADDPTPLPQLQQVVLLDGSTAEGVATAIKGAVRVVTWSTFVDRAASVSDEAARDRMHTIELTDISDILFTSGTTGRPKGVIMSHAQTVRKFLEWCDFSRVREGDRYLIVNPFFHMFGYKSGWLASFMLGMTVYPVAVFDVPTILELIQREKITVFPGAPTIYRSILDHPDLANYDVSSLRIAVTGAADIPVSLIEEMRSRLPFEVVVTGYGLTEATTVTGSRPDDDAITVATTAGRAMKGFEVIIADADGNEVERGVTGELLARGDGVMQGYLDDPEATAEAIDTRGFLHTGDLATMDERGYVRIVGRLKDMFIVGGFNVYPAELENILLGHPAIAQVAVIGVPDERMGEVGHAFVVAKPGVAADDSVAGEIIAWARENMANYKVPRGVSFVDALPMNASGKVLKNDLRDLAARQRGGASGAVG